MRHPGGRPRLGPAGLLAAIVLIPSAGDDPLRAAPPAPPVTSTGAPHPSVPTVQISGMTLEVRSGRVLVTDVTQDSPADRAGVLPEDILLVVNDRSLVDLDPISPNQVIGLLRQEPTGSTRLVIGRGAGTRTIELPGEPGWIAPASTPSTGLDVGSEAPSFSGRDQNGREVVLGSLRGRPVLIDFWESTCAPCVRAVIPLRRISEQYGDRLQILGVSLDKDRKAFDAFVYNQHLPGVQLFDGAGWRGPIPRLYEVGQNGIPRYILLDARGRVVLIDELDRVEKAIARLVQG